MNDPGSRNTKSARIWDGTWEDLVLTGREEGFAPATLLGDTADALAGYIRCPRCGGTPVPVEFGNLAGRPLRDWIADAEKAVRYQKCKGGHAPVLVGAAGPAVAGEDEWCATHDNWASYCPCGTQASSQAPAASGAAGQAATEGEGTGERTEPPAPASGHGPAAVFRSFDPADARHAPPPVPVPAPVGRPKQGLTTAHALTCKCEVCKPAKESKR